ncbi:MAG: serine/threonine protein kinase [Acidimicrobiia bacterium]|nr:serine/threonine protein kinase [Acidimicrobiia bacterium]
MPEASEPPAAAPAATTAAVGQVLAGRYQLERLLAIGGMGEVWRAHDNVLDRPVAVKVLHRHLAAEPSVRVRFEREARGAGRLHHPHIVRIYDTCTGEGLEAIVLELVDGPTLRQLLDRHSPLDATTVRTLGIEMAGALDVAHRAGLIHRDIKPANILLAPDGRFLLTDFGIAKAMDASERTATGAMLGSVKYVSPEQVQGHAVDARSDLFSLGIVLYECLAGRVPWQGDSATATAFARLQAPPAPLAAAAPDAPQDLVAAIEACLALDTADRPASAEDLVELLRHRRAAPLPGTVPGRSGGGTTATTADRRPHGDGTHGEPPIRARQEQDPTPPQGTALPGAADLDATAAHTVTTAQPAAPPPAPGPATAAGRPAPRPSARPPAAQPAAHSMPTGPDRPPSSRDVAPRRRRWVAPLVISILILVALVVAAMLVLGTEWGQQWLDDLDLSGATAASVIGEARP